METLEIEPGQEAPVVRTDALKAEELIDLQDIFGRLDKSCTGLVHAADMRSLLCRTGEAAAVEEALESITAKGPVDFVAFVRAAMGISPVPLRLAQERAVRKQRLSARVMSFLIGVLLALVFSVISYFAFRHKDWQPQSHLPYDTSTSYLLGSCFGRLLWEAIFMRPWVASHHLTIQRVRLVVMVIVGLVNTLTMRQLLNISGHLANAIFAAVYSSYLPQRLDEKILNWLALAAALSTREVFGLDCCWVPELRDHVCVSTDPVPRSCASGKWNDPRQTRIPLIVGLLEALLSCALLVLLQRYLRRIWFRRVVVYLGGIGHAGPSP